MICLLQDCAALCVPHICVDIKMPTPRIPEYRGSCAACKKAWEYVINSTRSKNGCALPTSAAHLWKELGLVPHISERNSTRDLCQRLYQQIRGLQHMLEDHKQISNAKDAEILTLQSSVRMLKSQLEASLAKQKDYQTSECWRKRHAAIKSRNEKKRSESKPGDHDRKQPICTYDHEATISALKKDVSKLKEALKEAKTAIKQLELEKHETQFPSQSPEEPLSQESQDECDTEVSTGKVSIDKNQVAEKCGAYSPEFVRMTWGLLALNIATKRVPEVLELIMEYSVREDSMHVIPSIRTIIRWHLALGLSVSQLQAGYEIAQSESCTLHSDGTSKRLVKYYTAPVACTRPDGSEALVLPGAVDTQPSGTAEDTANGIKAAIERVAAECKAARAFKCGSDRLKNLLVGTELGKLLTKPTCYMSDNEASAQATGKIFIEVQKAVASEHALPETERIAITCATHSMCLGGESMATAVSDGIKAQIGDKPDWYEMINQADAVQKITLREFAKFFSATEKLWPFGHQKKHKVWYTEQDDNQDKKYFSFPRCVGNRYHVYFEMTLPFFAMRESYLLYIGQLKEDDVAGKLACKLSAYIESAELLIGLQIHARFFVYIFEPHRVAAKAVGWHVLDAIPFLKKIHSTLQEWVATGFPPQETREKIFDGFPVIMEHDHPFYPAMQTLRSNLERKACEAFLAKFEKHFGCFWDGGRLDPDTMPQEVKDILGKTKQTNDNSESTFGILDRHMHDRNDAKLPTLSAATAISFPRPLNWLKFLDEILDDNNATTNTIVMFAVSRAQKLEKELLQKFEADQKAVEKRAREIREKKREARDSKAVQTCLLQAAAESGELCKSSGELQEGMSKHSNKTAQRKVLMTQKRLAVAMGVKAKDLPSGTQDRKHLDVQDFLSRLGAAFDSIDWKSLQKVDPYALPTGPQFRDSKQDLEALRSSLRAPPKPLPKPKSNLQHQRQPNSKKEANHAKRQAKGRKSNRIKRSDSDSDSEELQEDLGACEGFDKVKLGEIVALYNIKPREATENDEAWQKRIQAFPTSPWTLGVVIAKDTNIPDEDGDPCPHLKLQLLGTANNDLLKDEYGFAEEESKGEWVYQVDMTLSDATKKNRVKDQAFGRTTDVKYFKWRSTLRKERQELCYGSNTLHSERLTRLSVSSRLYCAIFDLTEKVIFLLCIDSLHLRLVATGIPTKGNINPQFLHLSSPDRPASAELYSSLKHIRTAALEPDFGLSKIEKILKFKIFSFEVEATEVSFPL
eukprot:g76995.t1